MSPAAEPAQLEHQGWTALSTGPEAARAFYAEVLDEAAEMLFPGGMRLTGKARILEMMGGQPWAAFELSDVRELALSDAARAVSYAVSAERQGQAPYRALVTSVYALRSGEWKLIVHQQTPE
jgi:hypothetical protein